MNADRLLIADRLAACLRDEAIPWPDFAASPAAVLGECEEHGVVGLLARHVAEWQDVERWPDELVDELQGLARADAAREALRRREIAAVLGALAGAGVAPVLIKGTPHAYALYPEPHLRPREDTDLMVPHAAVDAVRRVLNAVGYQAPVYCESEMLFRQFELTKIDAHGLAHAFDVHWKCSTQTLFADMLGYDELAAEAEAVPRLGSHARAAGRVHALLLAAVHPVMHHRATDRLVWTLDVHLLVQTLSRAELERFAALARARGVAAICRHALDISTERFGTLVPDEVRAALAHPTINEPTAAYLDPSRRWHDEFRANVAGLERWSDRLRFVREVLLPGPDYIRRSYGWKDGVLASALLPALYLHRGARGAWNVLRGRK
jgi:hypothetical protein